MAGCAVRDARACDVHAARRVGRRVGAPPRRVPLAAGRPPPCRIIALRHAQTAHRSFHWCKVCDYVRIYDEDEGCGVSADSQKFSADSSGYKGKTILKDDIHNDAACFDVYLK